MTNSQLLEPSYFKYALRDQHNLVLLFGAACFSLAYASHWPLLLGLGGELVWLALGPRLPAFRRWVDQRASAAYLARAETAIQGALTKLPEPEVVRFLALSREAAKFAAEANSTLAPRERLLGLHALLELRRTFLDYAFLSERLRSLIDVRSSSELEREATELQQAYGNERELTRRMTLRKALVTLKQRISEQADLTALERHVARSLDELEQMIPALRAEWLDTGESELAPALERALAKLGRVEALETALDQILERPAPNVFTELPSRQAAQEGPRFLGPVLR